MNKIEIWGDTIPFNSPESKLPDMCIKGKPNVVFQTLRFVAALPGEKYKDKRRIMDTFTFVSCINRDHEKSTYEDVPTLTPFIAEGSDRAVIVVPGGGFAYKSSDVDGEGKQSEGDLIARELNKAGISAFVLWYRSNPYRFPAPLLDMQRAVRYLRYHAADYGIDPNKIGAVGFSAGGYEIAGLINILSGKDEFPSDYTPDAIDAVSDCLDQAAMIYPCLNFRYLMPMLNCCFSAEALATEEQRSALCRQYDCVEQFRSADIPQFLAYGTKDILVNPKQNPPYEEKGRSEGTDLEVLVLPGANHGFSMNKKYSYWLQRYLDWSTKHFSRA